ncbi:MAG: YggS family pyridoxal phosphate-dependent enzyme [Desulfovibrionaceae bacterium]|nr:YggS family pyridoxal phosphate-dependent enzyme [Desulfovibrionaceae bacterium]
MSALTERFDAIWARIAAAATRSGRPADAVRLVAVSKLHNAEAVAELARHWSALEEGSASVWGQTRKAGFCEGGLTIPQDSGIGRGSECDPARRASHRMWRVSSSVLPPEQKRSLTRYHAKLRRSPVFGESYMQEAREKMPRVQELLATAPEWHFIGHVQSKKARDIVGRFSLIHSVDSLKLAQALGKAWQARVAGAPLGLDEAAPGPQNILVQVNVGREAQKSGVDPDALEPLLQSIAAIPELKLQGLMCIPPLADIGEDSRPSFVLLRELRDRMESGCGLCLPELSMGMSDDFEAAIEEGATLVRIGTDIFGSRAAR